MSAWSAILGRRFGWPVPDKPRRTFRFKNSNDFLIRYGAGVASVALVLVARITLHPLLGDKHPFTFFFAAVAVTSWIAGFGPSILAIVLSYFAADWFVAGATHKFDHGLDDIVGLVGFIASGLAIAFTSRALHRAHQRAELKQLELAGEIDARILVEEDLIRARQELNNYATTLETKVEERTSALTESLRLNENVLYHVAHDLRAPLRSMHGFITILLADYGNQFDTEGRNLAERVINSASRMDELIRDLLDYGRLGHVDLPVKPVQTETVLEAALSHLTDEIQQKGGSVTLRRPFAAVMANESLLRQMLINLISNALIYMAPGVIPQVEVSTEISGRKVRIYVKDNGVGIPKEYHEKIFRVFERLQMVDNPSGTGIGLAIVAKGAERMKGSAGVESESGKGSRFWVELPKAGGRR